MTDQRGQVHLPGGNEVRFIGWVWPCCPGATTGQGVAGCLARRCNRPGPR